MTDNDSLPEETKKEWLQRVLDLFGELFILNVIFVISIVPVFTIGASVSALYASEYRLLEKREGAVVKNFINDFKKNFKTATVLWLIIIFYFIVLYAQYYLAAMTKGIIGNIYIVIMFISLAIGIITLPYIFLVNARYNNTVRNTIINSFLLGISNLWSTMKLFCLSFGLMAISVIYPVIFLNTWFLWIFILFSLTGYLSSKVAKTVFAKTEEKKSDK